MLSSKRVLIVLDHVDELEQLEKLAISTILLGSGSRIIIITRDEHVLKVYGADIIYKVPLLNDNDALELFLRKAFNSKIPGDNKYVELIPKILEYAQNLPIAIKVLGSFLQDKDVIHWENVLERKRNFPIIEEAFQKSFEELRPNEKEIFLHIACFFHGEKEESVKQALDSCGLYSHMGIQVIKDKSLIIIKYGEIHMHEMLQELGKKIVRAKCPEKPGSWSRLWLYKDFESVLMSETGTNNVKAIVLNEKEDISKYAQLRIEGLSKMGDLQLLILYHINFPGELKHLSNNLRYLLWDGYPFSSLPLFEPYSHLVELNLPNSSIERLWKGHKTFPYLERVDLSNSEDLMETPNFEGCPNLQRLNFTGCTNLKLVDSSIGLLTKLKFLLLRGCTNLDEIPDSIYDLKYAAVDLSGCKILGNPKGTKFKEINQQEDGRFYLPPHLQPISAAAATLKSSRSLPKLPPSRGYEALESRMSILNEIKEALKDSNINMIGVYGMGGVGKTTLMEELACLAKTEKLFKVVLMVTSITNTLDFRSIQGQLADGLGLELRAETYAGRARELHARIRAEGSILIILDDIWDELQLQLLGVPYFADRKECKLVLTSRDRDVLSKKMNTQKDFHLEVFSEGESWNLFEKIVGDLVKQKSINSIAVDVVKCCAGLPLLIDIVAKDLRKEWDDRVWKNTLRRLQSNSGGVKDKVNCVLKVSYERLKHKELKSLFLIIGSFGQVGIGIDTEELFQVCWGLGMLDVSTLAEARNRQHTLIEHLRASSLLLDGETKWVRMHDLVHDVAKLIASETRCTYTGERLTKINEWPRNDQLQNCHHIILRDYRIPELPEQLECPKLEVLLLYFTENYLKLKIPDNFFSEMREVKVLSLSRMKLTNPPPLSLRCLAGLRSLNLSNSELEDISIIGELTSLEILILERAKKLEKLPKKIGDLTHLRVLNVNECQCLTFIPENLLSSLEWLEELYMKACPIKWKVEGSNNSIASLGELRNLDKLTDLHLEITDGSTFPRDLHNFKNLERYDISIGGLGCGYDCNFSRVLQLSASSILTLCTNVGVKALLTRVEKLNLRNSDCLAGDDFMKLGHLPELRHLILSGAYAGPAPITQFVIKVSNMPDLETLRLNMIKTCKIWEDYLDAHSHVRNLRTLSISHCRRLTSLFPSSVARALAELKHLYIAHCRRLKAIFVQEDISMEEVILPNLETLEIYSLEELELLWPSHLAPNSYCKLNKMEVSSCPKLSNVLFPSYVMNSLLNPKVTFPNLETLIISKLDELELLWPSHLAPNSYCKLNEIRVSKCPKLLNVFPSCVLNSLHNLEILDVSKCGELGVIFEIPEPSTIATNKQGLSTRLRTLFLRELPKLKYIWSKDPHGLLRFQNLCTVHVSDCGSLDHGFPFSVVENLQHLKKLFINTRGIKNIFEKNDSKEVELFSLEELMVNDCDGLKNILPPSVVFQNLNKLHVHWCDGAVNVMSPTTAKSLSKLRVLKVSFCASLEEIVASENDGDAPSGIIFLTLEELELGNLPRLESFCRGNYSFNFPLLKKVHVWKCDMMETFGNGNLTTPSLTVDR